MRIVNYIKSLLPDMEKRKVVNSLQLIREELADITIPVYEQTSRLYPKANFKSKEVKEFDTFIKKRVSSYKGNFLHTTLLSLKKASETVEALITVFNNFKGDKVYRDGITLLTANQLQYSQLASFVATYARRWLLFFYSLESNSTDSENNYTTTNEYRREKEYLDKNSLNFASGLNILSKSYSEVEEAFKSLPDIVVDPDSPVDPSITMGASKVDPLQFGLVPTSVNYIYQIRMAYTYWQLKRHTLMVEEKRQLELKLLLLKQSKSKDSTEDPKLEKQIENGENRLEKLRYEIERLEEAGNV